MKKMKAPISKWKDKAEMRLKIREKAKIMFDRYAIYKDNPIAWSVWKIAFNIALNHQFNEQKEYASIVNKDSAGSEAIKFADWISGEGYRQYDGVGRWIAPHNNNNVYSTKQLYKMFKESQT